MENSLTPGTYTYFVQKVVDHKEANFKNQEMTREILYLSPCNVYFGLREK